MLVATAGHVDHGKTSLVRQLTGVDTDRLAEEKKRGLTIELGYAFSDTPSGEPIGFIDVPGHERFINTMIAGISGIDVGMLVVAANDGIMPQTLEHLEVLRLLGVDRFVGVTSKIDLVDRDRLTQVEKQIAELIPQSPLCRISNKTGEGVEQLHDLLVEQSASPASLHSDDPFRMYVDRVFTKKGAGLVVTGTCLSGRVAHGDTLFLHTPASNSSTTVRVREVHSQGRATSDGHAGQRCALNLAGKVTREHLQRGSFLCANPVAEPSQRLDTRCRISAGSGRGLKHLGRVKLHLGSRRLGAATYLLGHEGSDQRVQLILDNGVVAFHGDRFVLRSDNERTTLAGGMVIDPIAPQTGKTRLERLQKLNALECEQPGQALEQLLFKLDDVVSLQWFSRIWNLSPEQMHTLLQQYGPGDMCRMSRGGDEFLVSKALWENHGETLLQELAQWHARHPMEPGIDPVVLQAKLKKIIPRKLFRALLDEHVRAGQVVYRDQWVHALGHKPTLSHQVQREWLVVEKLLQSRGMQLPLRSEIMRESGFTDIQLERLVRPVIKRGEMYEVGEKRLALPGTLARFAELVETHLECNAGISVIEAKQLFGLGRGLTIEVLEFLDSIGYTSRAGDVRVLADPSAVEQL